MIGELNVGHAYVGGGDMPKPPRIPTGLLGAELERDPRPGYYQIAKILKGQNWDPKLRSPLTEIGVDVKEGDYIIAVDGQPTNEMTNIYEALVNTAGKQVTLKVNAAAEARRAAARWWSCRSPTSTPLYYHDWVQGNIKKVSEGHRRQGRLPPHPRHAGRRA